MTRGGVVCFLYPLTMSMIRHIPQIFRSFYYDCSPSSPNRVAESTSHSYKLRRTRWLRCSCTFLSNLDSRFLRPRRQHALGPPSAPVNAARFPASHMITNRSFPIPVSQQTHNSYSRFYVARRILLMPQLYALDLRINSSIMPSAVGCST